MVEHNSQLRALVRSLAQQNEQKEQELKVLFKIQFTKLFSSPSIGLLTCLSLNL
jgi:hypothetical protein